MSKCEVCGTESPFDAGFIKERKSFSKGHKTACPTCWMRRRNSRARTNLILVLIVGLFGIVFQLIVPASDFGRFLVTLFLIEFFLVATIIPHELGHAAVAKLLGWRVFQVVIGVGKPMFKRRLLGVLFDFRWLPIGGLTFMAPIELRWFRTKQFLIVLAGPAVNTAMAIAVLVIWHEEMSGFYFFDLPLVPCLFLWANILVLVINLWPRTLNGSFRIPSDGKKLLMTFSFDQKAQEELKAARFALEAQMCRDENQLTQALEWCEKGLALHPENFPLLNMTGIIYLDMAEYESSHEIFVKLIAGEQKACLNRFIFLNNAAYAGALAGKPDLLLQADAFSKEAYGSMPWLSYIAGTRGTVLVVMGDYDAGIKLLTQAYETAESPHSKAENACYIAIARAKLGDVEQAEKFLAIAKRLDPLCRLITRIELDVKATCGVSR